MISKRADEFAGIDVSAGEVILIDKSVGDTSFDVVYKVRRAVGVKKVGHAGTLDPNATGLLIVCSGKKTKEISSFQHKPKTYIGVITLGKRTASFDADSEVLEEKPVGDLTDEQIFNMRDGFLGEIEQVPPMYSALKHKGKPLYKYARKGIEIKRAPRKVLIEKFDITGVNLPDIAFEIKCSKGTYIRVIADDFGQRLGCGAYLSSLRRTEIGEYSVDDAFTVDEFVEKFRAAEKVKVDGKK